ncbi:hypothetical protein TrVE_jg5834 [Triparma verrucosa]|uniref:protochlorophyllide reductase n=1 Tax=Triparma verrucosa TaxID=1606542 RepID=A0A9W7C3H0_9STRA|nr:hypothetical protein TrVE_jg5834 [Triparma verrucosa]
MRLQASSISLQASQKGRREVVSTAAAATLASILTVPNLADAEIPGIAGQSPKTILITGASSGIGFDAVSRFVSLGHTVHVPCRNLEKSNSIKDRLFSMSELPGTCVTGVCDLSDLNSIQQYANSLKSSNVKLDAVCLNAGLAPGISNKIARRTKQGFEETVGVNHFGHFKLMGLLKQESLLTQNSRVTITASGVHDPDSPGGQQGSKATLGDLSGLESQGRDCEMIDGGAYDPDKAYKDSKLCNVFFARELQKRNPNLMVNSFTPGLIVSTGLFRDQNPLFTKVFDVLATNVFKVGESVTWGGGALAYIALSDDIKTFGGYYGSKPGSSKFGDSAYGSAFSVDAVSKEVTEGEKKQQRLWELSEKLIQIS